MDTTLVLPTLNEEKNIGNLLNIINNMHPGMPIIIADDGSTDMTHDIVLEHKNAVLLDRSKEKVKGITASVLDAARLVHTGSMIVMDADLQHPPEKIREIADLLRFYDIVVGARKRVANQWPMHRKMMSWGGDALARTRLVFRPFTCLDMMSGFFGIHTDYFNRIIARNEDRFEKKGYKVMFETLKYAPKDIKIGHVSYDFGTRDHGESKIGMRHVVSHLKSIIK